MTDVARVEILKTPNAGVDVLIVEPANAVDGLMDVLRGHDVYPAPMRAVGDIVVASAYESKVVSAIRGLGVTPKFTEVTPPKIVDTPAV